MAMEQAFGGLPGGVTGNTRGQQRGAVTDHPLPAAPARRRRPPPNASGPHPPAAARPARRPGPWDVCVIRGGSAGLGGSAWPWNGPLGGYQGGVTGNTWGRQRGAVTNHPLPAAPARRRRPPPNASGPRPPAAARPARRPEGCPRAKYTISARGCSALRVYQLYFFRFLGFGGGVGGGGGRKEYFDFMILIHIFEANSIF